MMPDTRTNLVIVRQQLQNIIFFATQAARPANATEAAYSIQIRNYIAAAARDALNRLPEA